MVDACELGDGIPQVQPQAHMIIRKGVGPSAPTPL